MGLRIKHRAVSMDPAPGRLDRTPPCETPFSRGSRFPSRQNCGCGSGLGRQAGEQDGRTTIPPGARGRPAQQQGGNLLTSSADAGGAVRIDELSEKAPPPRQLTRFRQGSARESASNRGGRGGPLAKLARDDTALKSFVLNEHGRVTTSFLTGGRRTVYFSGRLKRCGTGGAVTGRPVLRGCTMGLLSLAGALVHLRKYTASRRRFETGSASHYD